MDFQNRAGNKVGGGGVAGFSEANVDRRERLRRLAMETMDLGKDPYFIKNNIGSYECRLCFTIHTNEGSYLAHTQGKKHQTNLAKRQLKDQNIQIKQAQTLQPKQEVRQFQKIGRPGYKITKLRDANTNQHSLLFEIEYPEIVQDILPRYRVMSAFEQKIEIPDERYQFVIFSGEPYENIAFKVPNYEIDNSQEKYFCHWDTDTNKYSVQIYFKANMNNNIK